MTNISQPHDEQTAPRSKNVLAALAGAVTLVVAVAGLVSNGGIGGAVFGVVAALTGLVIAGFSFVFLQVTKRESIDSEAPPEAQSEAEALLEAAYSEAEITLAEAELKADAVLADAEHRAEVTLNEAKNAAASVQREAEHEAQGLVATARAEASSVQNDAQRNAEGILTDARQVVAKMRAEAQSSAEAQLNETRAKIDELVADAEQKHSAIVSALGAETVQAATQISTQAVAIAKKPKVDGPEGSGSLEAEVIRLTKRIADTTEHLKQHKSDDHARRGLLLLVGRRRRLLKYVAQVDVERYRELIDRLGLRR